MCVVSMVGDDWRDRWNKKYPNNPPWEWGERYIENPYFHNSDQIKKELDDLKKEVKILKEQLKRAKQYDVDNNEPDCEIDEKMELLKKVADLVGIDLNEVLNLGEK